MLLNTHSYYSYRYGTVCPEELVDLCVMYGYHTVALTDINSTSASLSFVRLAKAKGLKPVLGVDFRNGAKQVFVALAINNRGYQEINAFLSHLKANQLRVPDSAPCFEHVVVIYPLNRKRVTIPKHENEFLGIRESDLGWLSLNNLRFQQEKLVLLHTSTFRNKRDFNAHRLLRAIDKNTLLSKLDVSEEGNGLNRFVPPSYLLDTYRDWPALIDNTNQLLDKCGIQFEFGEDAPHQNRSTYTGSEEGDWSLINSLCHQNIHYRYPEGGEAIVSRVNRELAVIREKGFLAYFLITWDLVRYAFHKNFFYVGRGSGANSIVAYLLRITDVDPIELDLYFERFINLFRRNPPDFDIDFSWRDRPHVTTYIFRRFGEDRTALLGAYVTFQFRAVVRELGKVFGVPKYEVDRLVKGEVNVKGLDELSLLVLKYGQYIQGFPNYLSIHAGGIVITEKPIHYFTATDMPPKGFATTHFDMVVAEDVGLYKYDILGQRGLSKIKETIHLVEVNQPNNLPADIHDVKAFKADVAIKKLLRKGKAIGCFYVESPAMRMLLTKLQVDNYLGLVAASSIIRPGVSKSGMMREYIKRFRDEKEREKAHPVMASIMPDTFGVMVYQEDVIKVAHHFAGLTLGEADVLRRGMSGKYRSRAEFQEVKEKFFINCKSKGYEADLTAEVWRQIESFAGYAFAKGHSASYAVESYQSLYLKAYYPLEYLVATVNNGGGFYSVELYLHEARVQGASIHPPCVNQSEQGCAIYGKNIFIGFMFIREMSETLGERILEERKQNGSYAGLEDFVDRVLVSTDELQTLIRVDAFRFTGEVKRHLMWKAYTITSKSRQVVTSEVSLFKPERVHYNLPDVSNDLREDLFDQLELLGFPMESPWLLLRDQTPYVLRANDLPRFVNEVVTIQAYLITTKVTTTSRKERMFFGTFIDQDGDWVDTVHFPDIAAKYPFRGKGIYTLTGTVVEEFGVLSIEVSAMRKEPYVEDPRYADVNQKYKAFKYGSSNAN